jgi:hypothetical protein
MSKSRLHNYKLNYEKLEFDEDYKSKRKIAKNIPYRNSQRATDGLFSKYLYKLVTKIINAVRELVNSLG